MALTISCAFATSMDTHEHVVLAEELGYERAWLYDSPALYPDVWVQLCRAAERTSRIGLGPGVLIPSLRHPMTTAAAIATLVDIAGAERVHVGVGSGFTGRFALGQKPLRWADVQAWVDAPAPMTPRLYVTVGVAWHSGARKGSTGRPVKLLTQYVLSRLG